MVKPTTDIMTAVFKIRLSISMFSCCLLAVLHLSAQEIKVNQLGYYPNSAKVAIVPGQTATNYVVVNDKGDTAIQGQLSTAKYWTHSEEYVQLADFTSLEITGQYKVVVDGVGESVYFAIAGDVYASIGKGLLKSYYFQRASSAIEETYGGIWKRNAGHPDTEVYVHSSAATANRPEGTVISGPKGWYDAGDFNKYIVNSGISTYTLMAMYEHYPDYFDEQELAIPETGNTIPDVLDEAKWNLDWMISMQDPFDGGVYHKLTSKNFTGEIMPEFDNTDRYVVQKTTAATLDFAAVMATASRVYAPYESTFPGFSDSCLAVAIKAWNWARDNNNIAYTQPDDVFTGAYGDNSFNDEFDWAATELYITTKTDSFYTMTNIIGTSSGVPGWQYVAPLAWVSLLHHYKELTAIADTTLIKTKAIASANTLVTGYSNSAYKIAMGTGNDFVWGSNAVAGNQGLILLQAYRSTSDINYLNAAISNLDYLLGRNPLGYCFVSGYGSKSPMHFHHRVSTADGIVAPVPGLVAGGPNPGQQDNCTYPSDITALSYTDTECSYASNEVAINWNAPVSYLACAIDAILNDDEPSAPIIIQDPQDVKGEIGQEVTLTVSALGSAPFTYQWLKGTEEINTATNQSLTITISNDEIGDYRAVVTNSMGSDTSLTATVSLLVQEPYSGTPIAIPGVVEAENYDKGGSLAYADSTSANQGGEYRTDAVDIAGASEGGYSIGWTDKGEWLEYTIEVDSTADYKIEFRHASKSFNGVVSIYIDDVLALDKLTLPLTGGWSDWASTLGELSLTEGTHIMKVYMDAGGVNLNYFNIQHDIVLTKKKDEIEDLGLKLFPNPTNNGVFYISQFQYKVSSIDVVCTDVSGKVIFEDKGVSSSHIEYEINQKGMFFIHIKTEKGIATQKLLVY